MEKTRLFKTGLALLCALSVVSGCTSAPSASSSSSSALVQSITEFPGTYTCDGITMLIEDTGDTCDVTFSEGDWSYTDVFVKEDEDTLTCDMEEMGLVITLKKSAAVLTVTTQGSVNGSLNREIAGEYERAES